MAAPMAAPLYAAPPGYPGGAPFVQAIGNWVDAAGGAVPPGAVVGGQDCNGEPIYVARARHEGAVIPGKLVASHGVTFVPWGGSEHGKPEYQVSLDILKVEAQCEFLSHQLILDGNQVRRCDW